MIMVCVTNQLNCAEMISYAGRLAKHENDSLVVLHICKEDANILGYSDDGEALQYLYDHTRAVGAEMQFIRSNKISQSIVDYAKAENVTKIIIGRRHSSGEESYIYKKLTERLPNVEILGYEKEEIRSVSVS